MGIMEGIFRQSEEPDLSFDSEIEQDKRTFKKQRIGRNRGNELFDDCAICGFDD